MNSILKSFSIVLLVGISLNGVSQQALLPTPHAANTVIVLDGKSFNLVDLNQRALEFLWTNGMPKRLELHVSVLLLPRDNVTMCRFMYSQGIGKVAWNVNIGYDGKVHGFGKHFATEGFPEGGNPEELLKASIPKIKDLKSFTTRLLKHSDAVSNFLWEGFLADTREVLWNYPGNGLPSQVMEEFLDIELTRAIGGSTIYDKQRFDGVQLSKETQKLLAEGAVSFEKVIRLNKLLLLDAYPAQLTNAAPIPKAILR